MKFSRLDVLIISSYRKEEIEYIENLFDGDCFVLNNRESTTILHNAIVFTIIDSINYPLYFSGKKYDKIIVNKSLTSEEKTILESNLMYCLKNQIVY